MQVQTTRNAPRPIVEVLVPRVKDLRPEETFSDDEMEVEMDLMVDRNETPSLNGDMPQSSPARQRIGHLIDTIPLDPMERVAQWVPAVLAYPGRVAQDPTFVVPPPDWLVDTPPPQPSAPLPDNVLLPPFTPTPRASFAENRAAVGGLKGSLKRTSEGSPIKKTARFASHPSADQDAGQTSASSTSLKFGNLNIQDPSDGNRDDEYLGINIDGVGSGALMYPDSDDDTPRKYKKTGGQMRQAVSHRLPRTTSTPKLRPSERSEGSSESRRQSLGFMSHVEIPVRTDISRSTYTAPPRTKRRLPVFLSDVDVDADVNMDMDVDMEHDRSQIDVPSRSSSPATPPQPSSKPHSAPARATLVNDVSPPPKLKRRKSETNTTAYFSLTHEPPSVSIPGQSASGTQIKLEPASKLKLPPPITQYNEDDNDMPDGAEGTALPGEDLHGDHETLVVRLFNEFIFFTGGNGELWGSGLAKSHFEGDSDSDEEENESASDDNEGWCGVKIGPILEYSEMFGDNDDVRVWLRTDVAWYILCNPHLSYQLDYRPFYILHIVTHFAIFRSKSNPLSTLDDFIKYTVGHKASILKEFEDAKEIIGVQTNGSITEDELDKLLVDVGKYLLRYSDLNLIKKVSLISSLIFPLTPSSSSLPTSTPMPSLHLKTDRLRGAEDHIKTMPIVGSVAQDHLIQLLEIVGGQPKSPIPFNFDVAYNEMERLLAISEQDRSIVLGPPKHNADDNVYSWVKIDEMKYEPGDIVYIKAGEDAYPKRAKSAASMSAQSINPLANTMWFAKIVYIFYDTEDQAVSIHVRWFIHGSKSMLQEKAKPQELFLLNECVSLDASVILGHCRAKLLLSSETCPLESDEEYELVFYYQYLYLSEQATYIAAHSVITTKEHLNKAICFCCEQKDTEQSDSFTYINKNSFHLNNLKYHVHDFIYIYPSSSTLLDLGQIISISSTKVKIQKMERNARADRHGLVDEHILVFLDEEVQVQPEMIFGKFFARHYRDFSSKQDRRKWIAHPNCFYISDSSSPFCSTCLDEELDCHLQLSQVAQSHSLQALDIFSGCGGFSTGLDQTEFIKTKWAIEWDEDAAMTLKRNSPHVEVYNQDINLILEHTVSQDRVPLKDILGQSMPGMPKPGEVDLIYGGPPCQSFSGANQHKQVDDRRHGLSLSLLSFVEYYRPKYVMIENVKGMAQYSLMDQNGKAHKMGVVKMIMAVLMELGYQVKINLLQAACYGTPQNRHRLIFLASKMDHPLPDFPLPTHAYTGSLYSVDLTDGFKLETPPFFAPLPQITVNDAISDLPEFHWSVKTREEGDGQWEYPLPPQTYYQKWLRQESHLVKQHFTRLLPLEAIKRVIHVPIQDGANYYDLPLKYQTCNFRHQYKGAYKRIHEDGLFHTSLTSMNPGCRNGQCLHPSQKRIITLREYARSQGFPDSFVFMSHKGSSTPLFRQVGNAVPVPLGIALGREFGKAILAERDQGLDDGGDETED